MATYYGRKYKLLEFRHRFKEFFLAVRIALKSQTLGKPNAERPLLVAMVDGESFHGGMCDRFKGILTLYAYCKQQGVECALSEVFAKGGEGGLELAQKVLDIMDDDAKINYAYDEDLTVDEKIKVLCSKIYGAKEVIFNKPALTMLKTLKANGYDKLPVCVAKTQYSFSDNASLLAAPTDFTMTVRELRLSAGAGFVVAVMGEIMTMPGLPKVPAALSIDVDENGVIKGLF